MPRDTKHLDLEEIVDCPQADQIQQLQRLLHALRHKRKIVVVAGAGISVSAGIPDFRSSNGLFKTLKSQHNLKGSGKDLFDAAVYRDATSITSFHQMVRSMSHLVKSSKPTAFHHLVARLAHEGRLLRLYSQNVDGLDTSLQPLQTSVPLPSKGPWPKTVQLHGGLAKMACTKCNSLNDFEPDLFDGPAPPQCQSCEEIDAVRTEIAGKRSHGVGSLRPRMVLYNEHNPDDEAIGAVTRADMRTRPDAVIVVGTSLKVPGVKRIVREMCSIVRHRRDGLSVWINQDPVPAGREFENCWDLIVKGTADEIADRAGLGKWDDPEIKIEPVADEQVDEVKQASQPQVVVEPRSNSETAFDLQQVSYTRMGAASPARASGFKQVNHYTPNPASKQGRPLGRCQAIKAGKIAETSQKKRKQVGRPPKKDATAVHSQSQNVPNLKAHFKVTKNSRERREPGAVSALKKELDASKQISQDMQEVNSASEKQTLARSQSQSEAQSGEGQPMDTIPVTNPRLNSSSKSPGKATPSKQARKPPRAHPVKKSTKAPSPKKQKQTSRQQSVISFPNLGKSKTGV